MSQNTDRHLGPQERPRGTPSHAAGASAQFQAGWIPARAGKDRVAECYSRLLLPETAALATHKEDDNCAPIAANYRPLGYRSIYIF